MALLLGLAGEGADQVIGLVALELVDRDVERRQDLADDRELVAQVIGRVAASRLVLGEAIVAEGAAGKSKQAMT